MYTVSQKNIPDIFDCNLKINYQILIIFGTSIPDTTCHQDYFVNFVRITSVIVSICLHFCNINLFYILM